MKQHMMQGKTEKFLKTGGQDNETTHDAREN